MLFRSAARAFGPRVIGVVLSGTLDDGTAGLEEIKQHGGIAVVQDPAEAVFPGMPKSALDNVSVDHVLPLGEMATVLMQLAQEPVAIGENTTMPNKTKHNNASPNERESEDMVRQDMAAQERGERRGRPSIFTCPDCGGGVWEHEEGGVLRYNCHVGHAYSAESFLAEQSDKLEEALWTALRALEESASVRRRLSTRMEKQGQHANVLRQVLENMQPANQLDNEEITLQEMQRLAQGEAESGL
jgi:two-component system chemotaxis response regulator CheB